MARLTTKERNSLPSKDFAEPASRKYPVENESHAKNALSRVSQFGSSGEKAKVKAKVKKKFPSIGGNKRGAPKYPSIAKEYLS